MEIKERRYKSLKRRSLETRKAAGMVKVRRTKEEADSLMWRCYQYALAGGHSAARVAQEFKLSEKYAYYLVWKARKIMQSANGFDPKASNLQKEMLKFMPMAADALTQNLQKAEPRVTVAYLQGVGALIPRQEVTTLTDEERKQAADRSLKAINPKLRKALGIEDGANATIEPDDPKNDV